MADDWNTTTVIGNRRHQMGGANKVLYPPGVYIVHFDHTPLAFFIFLLIQIKLRRAGRSFEPNKMQFYPVFSAIFSFFFFPLFHTIKLGLVENYACIGKRK